MSNKKQSSIEWLISQLQRSKDWHRVLNEVSQMSTDKIDIIDQAKAIHKHEITEAFKQGIEYWNGEEWKLIDVEAYYNQTYEHETN